MILVRYKQNNIGTWGKLEFSDFSCFTFEPVGDDEVRSGLDKRIPQGDYAISWFDSPRFKRRLPLIFNEKVPAERRILIHSGNYANDTEGCILLGKQAGEQGVFNSRIALDEFLLNLRLKCGNNLGLTGEMLSIINDF